MAYNDIDDASVQLQAEDDIYSQMSAKSSVKIKNTSKGLGWEIKVVTGEEKLLDGLIQTALKAHRDLKKEI